MGIVRDDLAELPLFSEASRSELAVIRRHLTQLSLPAGRVLVQEGARGDQFMIIAEGQATVSRGGRTVATLGPGDLVGEMALLDHDRAGRRNATVVARTDAVVYAGTPLEFRQILEAAPSVARKVRQMAAARTVGRAA
ncbi:MAG TPA: cyclic nucleotide-binding domain-containing protein [Acidimicrobiales bacterium]|nr:cyclic nucleotide-binding domain-containing protein [Acidimicrobiales bacterium]